MNRSFACCCILWVWSASALQAGGEWFALTDFNSYSRSNENHPLTQALGVRAKDKREFKCIAFTPEGDWIILLGVNDVWTNNGNLPAVKKLLELRDGRQKVNCVAFTPTNGWVVLCDRAYFHAGDISADALAKMDELIKQGNTLRSITFLPDGKWVVLVSETGVTWSLGIPDGLSKVLNDAFNKRIPIRCVASTTFSDWFVLTEKQFWASDPNHPAAKQLTKLKSARRSLKWVAVEPEDPATAQFRLEVKPKQRVKAVLKTDAFADGKVEDYVIFAPEVSALPGQKNVRATFNPAGKVVREEGPQQRHLILNRITDGRQEAHVTLNIEATLMSRQLRPLHAGEKAPLVSDLSPEEVKLYTLSSQAGQPNPGPFRDWVGRVGLKRKDAESEVAFAYRTFQYIKHHFQYAFPPGDRSASAVCAKGKSDCDGLSNLFTWIMRDHGVPARKLFGRHAYSGKVYDGEVTKADGEGKEHVKAEFFARGIGWIPVDTAAAVNSPHAGDFAFFGNDPGDFITLAHDPVGSIDTFLAGKREGVAAQAISLWWHSNEKTRKVRFETTWTVTKEPNTSSLSK
jgi:hypothetical protein